MPADMHLHGKPVRSVFELLGDRENDITYSLGWALACCDEFRRRVVAAVVPDVKHPETASVRLQERGSGGITDIELLGPNVHVIVEAKRALDLPGPEQLGRYAERLAKSPVESRALVTTSEASEALARTLLPPTVAGMPCVHISFRELRRLALASGGSHAEKRLLKELAHYLNRIARMQDITSNIVYVVALNDATVPDSSITWRQMVEDHHRYITLIGGSYPRIPVNYLGFRYGGQLRSICHVTTCEIILSMTGLIEGCDYHLQVPHYLYTLGPPIIPSKTVRNGKVTHANRVYAAIDLLLTCDTISEAGEKTRERLGRG